MNSGRERVPYFSRPKPPHDWRWRVGLLGRSMITLGLLMFAFVAYQLWGTGIQTAQSQRDLQHRFEELLDGTSTSSTTSTSATTTSSTVPDTTGTSSTSTPSTTSTIPVAPAGSIPEGTPVALLRIPRIHLDWTVVEGVGVPDLKKGPGHFPETPLPGQLGNAAIAGHRTTYGAPFFDLDQLAPGDRIEVSTLAGTFVYSVTGSTVVDPSEYGAVIPTTDPDTATLTLATCTPRYTARQRLIVTATLVAEESDQVMRPPSATVPADTSTTVPETLPGESTVPDTGATTTPATSDAPATTSPSPSTTVATPGNSGDAFGGGWFDDTGAIPHTLLWGVVLLAVVYGAYRAGKAARRLWVCWLVGAVPVVVVLYFFFENVNRLLPPSL